MGCSVLSGGTLTLHLCPRGADPPVFSNTPCPSCVNCSICQMPPPPCPPNKFLFVFSGSAVSASLRFLRFITRVVRVRAWALAVPKKPRLATMSNVHIAKKSGQGTPAHWVRGARAGSLGALPTVVSTLVSSVELSTKLSDCVNSCSGDKFSVQ